MFSLLRAVLLAFALCGLAVSVPADPHDRFRIQTSSSLLSYTSSSNSSPWTRFRDAIVQSIWGPTPLPKALAPLCADFPAIRAKYAGQVVLRFEIKSPEEARALANAASTLYLDIWESAEDWVDVRVAGDAIEPLLRLLPASLQDAHSPLMHDLVEPILDTYPPSICLPPAAVRDSPDGTTASTASLPTRSGDDPFFDDYQPLSVIQPWMRLMASLFPAHVQLINTGTSYEGRAMPALRVGASSRNRTDPDKPRQTIVISGGSHGREWISTAAVNYVADALITQYGRSGIVTKIVDEFDWVLVPTLNPDGYEYTWSHDRLWRKNRQPTSIAFCPGVDLARSYDFGWDGDANVHNPCLENYAGVVPFDGFEAQQFATWARNETERNPVEFAAFVDLHSYSQEVLYPYSFSCDQLPPTLENLEELGIGLAKAIRLTHGRLYSVMSACEGSTVAPAQTVRDLWPQMEPNGGSALDWFYQKLGVKYAYQIKLRDTGNYGFLLPRSEILPTGQEMFNAVVELGDFLLSNKGIELAADGDGAGQDGSPSSSSSDDVQHGQELRR